MFKFILTISIILQATFAENYAVLVAGSNTWYNYRHQADICHAYHTLLDKGFKAENIITFMFDDISQADENPYKGKIFNDPQHSKNYYENVKINYSGSDVNPQNFLSVLTGNASSVPKGKPVLKTTENDNIFINFSDHGGEGTLCFPEDDLEVNDLHNALLTMKKKKMFKNMLLYVEACHAGSMFKNLEKDLGIIVVTAANDRESSYACWFDESIETYLGDCFSVNWMGDTDVQNIWQESIDKQYKIVKKETNLSHVTMYGQKNMKTMKLGAFLQPKKSNKPTLIGRRKQIPTLKDAVDAMETATFALTKIYQKHVNNPEKREKALQDLLENLQKRESVKNSFTKIYNSLREIDNGLDNFEEILKIDYENFTEFDCLKKVRLEYRTKCYSINEVHQAALYHGIFYNMCSKKTVSMDTLLRIVRESC